MRQRSNLLGIDLFESDEYCDVMEEGYQYTDVYWELQDMKVYDGNTVFIYFDGRITIYNNNDEIIFEGSLLDSNDFKDKMRQKL